MVHGLLYEPSAEQVVELLEICMMLRFYDPNSGEILLDKVPYAEYEISSLRNMFGLVFQDYNAYAVSVSKNVTTTYEESKNDRERVVKSLELSGLYKKINGMEKGLETELTREFDEAGIVLSGGETQKLALARAYYKNAEFYFLAGFACGGFYLGC